MAGPGLEYAFKAGAKPDDPLSYEALVMRRKIAESLMGKRSPFPKTLGEGLTYLGESIGDKVSLDRLEAQQAAYEKAYAEQGRRVAEAKIAGEEPDTSAAPPPPPPPPTGPTAAIPASPAVMTRTAAPAITPPPPAVPDIPPDTIVDNKFGDVGGLTSEGIRSSYGTRRIQQPMTTPPPSDARFPPPDSQLNRNPQRPPGPQSSLDPRSAIKMAMLAQQGAVPPDPTQAGAATSSPITLAGLTPTGGSVNDAPPIGAEPRQQMAQASPVGGRFGQMEQPTITPAPPQAIRPVPAPPARQPIPEPPPTSTISDLEPPPIIKPSPMSKTERDATIQMMSTLDPNRKALWASVIQAEQEKRKFIDANRVEANKKQWENYLANQIYRREARQKEITAQKGISELPVEGAPVVPQGVYDSRLGTTDSPQRNGPVPPPPPQGTAPAKWAEIQATEIQKTIEAVDKATPEFKKSLDIIAQTRAHPGQEYGLGTFSEISKHFHGTSAIGFHALRDQLEGKNFLAGYQMLKGGGGNVSNIEGEKTQQAQARLRTTQNKEDFHKGLLELEMSMRADLEQAQRKAGRPVTAWQKTPNDPYAPDLNQRGMRDGKVQEYIGGNPAVDSSYRNVR